MFLLTYNNYLYKEDASFSFRIKSFIRYLSKVVIFINSISKENNTS